MARLNEKPFSRAAVAFGTLAVATGIAAVVGATIIFSGIINIGATVEETGITKWVLHETMENSVERHAGAVRKPGTFDERQISDGFHHFREMCPLCHGAPGVRQSEIGEGLRPSPPDLAKAAPGMSDEEIFWITANGIRMTGMPAFIKTHSERDIWGIVATVKNLPKMTPEEYRALVQADAEKAGAHGHDRHHEH